VRTEAAFAVVLVALCAVLAPRTGAAFLFAFVTLPAAAAGRVVARPFPMVALATVLGVLGSVTGASIAGILTVPGIASLLAARVRGRVRSS
jgi:ABC-type Mn2+/Zn2+ transport system permease subunit